MPELSVRRPVVQRADQRRVADYSNHRGADRQFGFQLCQLSVEPQFQLAQIGLRRDPNTLIAGRRKGVLR